MITMSGKERAGFMITESVRLSNPWITTEVSAVRGAMLTEVLHRPSGLNWLRRAPNHHTLIQSPFVYGMPPLCPPGRVARGRFTLDHHEFSWPTNDHAGPNTLHGFGWDRPWTITRQEEEHVQLALHDQKAADLFGAPFLLEIGYALNHSTLRITAQLTNEADFAIPAALGFHTDIDLNTTDYLVQLPSLEPWELNKTLIPTGRRLAAVPSHTVRARTIHEDQPYSIINTSNEIVLTMIDGPCRIHMKGDESFRQLVIYRPSLDADFFAIEPYTWVPNAPNLPLPDSLTGLMALPPGSTQRWNYEVRFEML